jgi:alkanesulfonate monooxygenase SsuD/methylene tetrahydromethanopterin reductase-like flavin-dependent oxidoreductase (luciferase family)
VEAVSEFSPVLMSWAARRTSAVTAWWTCAGVRVPSRYLDRARNWMRHRPSRAVAVICGSGSSGASPDRSARISAATATNWSIMSL